MFYSKERRERSMLCAQEAIQLFEGKRFLLSTCASFSQSLHVISSVADL